MPLLLQNAQVDNNLNFPCACCLLSPDIPYVVQQNGNGCSAGIAIVPTFFISSIIPEILVAGSPPFCFCVLGSPIDHDFQLFPLPPGQHASSEFSFILTALGTLVSSSTHAHYCPTHCTPGAHCTLSFIPRCSGPVWTPGLHPSPNENDAHIFHSKVPSHHHQLRSHGSPVVPLHSDSLAGQSWQR